MKMKVIVTGKKKSNELMHSDIYLGTEYDDGIRHWKYIKKEVVNGKTRYYYDSDTDNMYKNNGEEVNVRQYKTKNGDTKTGGNLTKYKDTNKLFNNSYKQKVTEKGSVLGIGYETSYTEMTKERGKIERAVAKAEKWIFNKFLKKKNK